MKLEIDYKNKTVAIVEEGTAGELFTALEQLGESWRKYKIVSTIRYTDSQVYKEYPYPNPPGTGDPYPFPNIIYTGDTNIT